MTAQSHMTHSSRVHFSKMVMSGQSCPLAGECEHHVKVIFSLSNQPVLVLYVTFSPSFQLLFTVDYLIKQKCQDDSLYKDIYAEKLQGMMFPLGDL